MRLELPLVLSRDFAESYTATVLGSCLTNGSTCHVEVQVSALWSATKRTPSLLHHLCDA